MFTGGFSGLCMKIRDVEALMSGRRFVEERFNTMVYASVDSAIDKAWVDVLDGFEEEDGE